MEPLNSELKFNNHMWSVGGGSHCLPLIRARPQLPGLPALSGPGSWLPSSSALMWASLWFEEYGVLRCSCPKAMLECSSDGGGTEEESDLTVWCGKENGPGVTHYGCNINKAEPGFLPEIGRWPEVNAHAHALAHPQSATTTFVHVVWHLTTVSCLE